MTIGERIKVLRRKNDLTQERLAEYLSVSSQAVSKWECGLACPDLALIIPLARILHVSADELLGGTTEETDARQAELDKLCRDSWKYNNEEMYETAKQAVSEYPGNYKYLMWLAGMESTMKMYDRSIQHYNIVIEECTDSELKNKAISETMFCYRALGKADEAMQYAKMLPNESEFTRDHAMLACLQGEELQLHKQMLLLKKFYAFLRELTGLYMSSTEKNEQATAAMDLKERILNAVFPDENYLEFWHELCYIYEKRAELEVSIGAYDKAIEYLRVMIECGKKYTESCNESRTHTCDVFNKIRRNLAVDFPYRPFIVTGDERNTKPILEQMRIALTNEKQFDPLWDREDFKKLLEF